MANNYKPHIRVLLEDKPYRDIINGVTLSTNIKDYLFDIRKPCDGWTKVFKELNTNYLYSKIVEPIFEKSLYMLMM